MTFMKLASEFDKNAVKFAAKGETEKSFVAMEIAATIRRMGDSVLKLEVPENFMEA